MRSGAADILRSFACVGAEALLRYGQGWMFGQPMPFGDVARMRTSRRQIAAA